MLTDIEFSLEVNRNSEQGDLFQASIVFVDRVKGKARGGSVPFDFIEPFL
jgi:hypothetical protein